MFLRNDTQLRPVLRRAHLTSDLGVATVAVQIAFRRTEQGRFVLWPDRPALPSDPPDTAGCAIWQHVGVTAAGSVLGVPSQPGTATVTLTVGAETRAIAVFGGRTWVRAGRDLVPSRAARFDTIPMAFEAAFGGTYVVAPGPDTATGLPHPGGPVAFPANPGGIGFYPSEAAAIGRPLPSFEWPDDPSRQWSDRPDPAGLAPCPMLSALRLDSAIMARVGEEIDAGGLVAAWPTIQLRQQHHAHGRLIFEAFGAGTRVSLAGLGPSPMSLEVAPPALSCVALRGSPAHPRATKRMRPELRAVHLSADEGVVLLTMGMSTTYCPRLPPDWIQLSLLSQPSLAAA